MFAAKLAGCCIHFVGIVYPVTSGIRLGFLTSSFFIFECIFLLWHGLSYNQNRWTLVGLGADTEAPSPGYPVRLRWRLQRPSSWSAAQVECGDTERWLSSHLAAQVECGASGNKSTLGRAWRCWQPAAEYAGRVHVWRRRSSAVVPTTSCRAQ